MGAENLENTATDRGHDIDVEVQGAMGTENELSSEAIQAADAVIIAADTSVSQDRFEGKPLVKSNIKAAVNDADGLIDEAIEKAGGDSDAVDVADDTEQETATEETDTASDENSEEQTDRKEASGNGGLIGAIKDIFS
ncbi:Phosphotransferase system fructose-specific component IIB [Natranaeroarchaeum sulfidigenes]|uniref:Phosphotransferase system fructose-specific component IIB n=2 Tax=Natranaeroarchaeum sulfidigenes TaxID=2784880 RepID=A0A897MR54_9EURY|nr:Phosphotransferase system fructose-specific component IIB [Natranaeroarchaeum sulfidigenes]